MEFGAFAEDDMEGHLDLQVRPGSAPKVWSLLTFILPVDVPDVLSVGVWHRITSVSGPPLKPLVVTSRCSQGRLA